MPAQVIVIGGTNHPPPPPKKKKTPVVWSISNENKTNNLVTYTNLIVQLDLVY